MDTSVQCLPEGILFNYQFQTLNFRRLNRTKLVCQFSLSVVIRRGSDSFCGKKQTSYHYLKRVQEISQRITDQ